MSGGRATSPDARLMTAADVHDEYDLLRLVLWEGFVPERFRLMSAAEGCDAGLPFGAKLLARAVALICDTVGELVKARAKAADMPDPDPVARMISNTAALIERTDCFDSAAAECAGGADPRRAFYESVDAAMRSGRFGAGMGGRCFFGGGDGRWSPAVAEAVAGMVEPVAAAALAKAALKNGSGDLQGADEA